MLELKIDDVEAYDEANNEFITIKGGTMKLEHSLVSLSKWESKWNKPFLSDADKTLEETLSYIKFMTISKDMDDRIYKFLPDDAIEKVNAYISASMTATTFSDRNKGAAGNREIITAEIIYYWMIAFNIPFECQKWHLNRLLTLVKVCSIKNGPQKKMSASEITSRNAQLNAARRKAMNSRG